MNFINKILITSVASISVMSIANSAEKTVGKWTINYDEASHKTSFVKEGKVVLSGVSAKFKFDGKVYDTSSLGKVDFSESKMEDAAGSATKYVIRYTDSGDASFPEVRQNFYLYDGANDYFLTDVEIVSKSGEIATNYIAPIYTEAKDVFLPKNTSNRFITVPFDNDGFITYGSFPLSRPSDPSSLGTGRVPRDSISFEVTSVFNGETQEGLVVGSVEHDKWKSAVRLTGSALSAAYLSRLEVFSGVTHSATRDAVDGVVMSHGNVKGNTVKSAKMLVGLFADWRDGMETYGDINNKYSPKRAWNGPTPFGWNSWGGMSTHVNYEGVISASDFIKENIQDKNDFGKGVVFVGLDSYWDNMNWDQLKDFAQHCRENGQVPGIYWTPWCDWFPDNNRAMEGNNGYFYQDAQLKVNGVKKKNCGAGCLDPTHPATISRLNYYIDRFKEMGFKYIKLDFMTNGIVEADSYYNKNITTGVEAYNYGMKTLADRCGDDMFIVLSIAPLFPSQYANARRISCDAWGEMWHTNYMMNSLSFGWWLSKVYSYNDPDHLVMGDRSKEENMSRMTTACVTGYCMLGDNLSTKGSYVGSESSQQKAVTYTSNKQINDVIGLGKSFRPAYGHKVYGSNRAVDLFTLETEDSYYVAYFNYGEGEKKGELSLKSLGIDDENVDVARSRELWFDAQVTIADGKLQYDLPNDQAKVYRLMKKK